MSDRSAGARFGAFAAGAGLILFLGSRVAIEANRIGGAGDDQDFLLLNTAVTAVVTISLFALAVFAVQRTGHRVLRAMLTVRPDSKVILLGGYGQSTKSIALLSGEPFGLTFSYFLFVVESTGIEIWRGSRQPRMVVSVLARDIANLERSTLLNATQMVTCVSMTVMNGSEVHEVLFVPEVQRRFKFAPMSDREADQLIVELRALWGLHERNSPGFHTEQA
jgi:hypothetical protein